MTEKKAPGGRGMNHEARTGGSEEWYTPLWVFERLGLWFDIDPCHPVEPLYWTPATQTYNIETDGLAQEWLGLVYMNPPYGNKTYVWMKKLHAHGNGVALVFARTDTKWYHECAAKADCILFLKKRVRFVNREQQEAGEPGCGSMLVGWGDASYEAIKAMADLGHLVDLRLQRQLEAA